MAMASSLLPLLCVLVCSFSLTALGRQSARLRCGANKHLYAIHSCVLTCSTSDLGSQPRVHAAGTDRARHNFTGYSNVTVPTVALTFGGGVTIDLDVASGILLDGCLAFVPGGEGEDGDIGVIGNVNQRKFEVLYDSARGHVGFRPGAC